MHIPLLILEKKKKSNLNRKGLVPRQQRKEQSVPKHQALVRNGEQDWLVEVEAKDKAGKAVQVEGIHTLFANL